MRPGGRAANLTSGEHGWTHSVLAQARDAQPGGSPLAHRYAGSVSFWAITTGRSGTTTLARLLEHTPGVDAVHEPYPSLFFEGRLAMEGHAMPLPYAARLLHATRGWLVEGSHARRRLPFDASPLLSHLAEPIRHAFGDARFVHLVRRPRAFVRSALGSGWCDYSGPMADAWPRAPDPSWEQWQCLVWLWAEVHRKGLELERAWGPEVVRRLPMDDLVSGPDGLEGLLTWMGLDVEHLGWVRGAAFQTLAQTRNPSPTLPPWEPGWEGFLEEVAGDVARELGVDAVRQDGRAPVAGRRPPAADPAGQAMAGAFCRMLGVDVGSSLGGGTVMRVEGGEILLRVESEPAPPLRLSIVAAGRGPHFARSARFGVSYRCDQGQRPTAAEVRVLESLAARMRERDPEPAGG